MYEAELASVFYTAVTIAGICTSLYWLLYTVQKKLDLQYFTVALCTFFNLLGFIVSPSVIAASFILHYPLKQSLMALNTGDTAFTMALALFSSYYLTTLDMYTCIKKPIRALTLLLIPLSVLDLTLKMVTLPLYGTINIAELVSIVAASSFLTLLALNLLSALYTMRSLNLFTDKVLSEYALYRRKCSLLCFILITLCFLPKECYNVINQLQYGTLSYFEDKTFLISRTLIYLSSGLQALCFIKCM